MLHFIDYKIGSTLQSAKENVYTKWVMRWSLKTTYMILNYEMQLIILKP